MNPTTDQVWKMLDADMHLQTLHPNYAPEELLEMVAPAPKRVLDLGCFCGGSGRWLKRRFPGCEVVGIEMLDRAAAMAAQVYDRVISGTFEQVDFAAEGLKQGSFDAIIAADVLEPAIHGRRCNASNLYWRRAGRSTSACPICAI